VDPSSNSESEAKEIDMAARKASATKRGKQPQTALEAQQANYADMGKKARAALAERPDNPKKLEARRQREAQRKQEEVEGREKLLQEAWAPGKHPDVAVSIKRTERAARAEQERIDEGKRAAAKQKPFRPASHPDDEGFVKEPAHPLQAETPDGPQGEDVIYRTNDIDYDGTPYVRSHDVEPTPEWDGENSRDYNELFAKMKREWKLGEADPVIPKDEDDVMTVSTSPESAEHESKRFGQEIRFVPNDAYLDPVRNDPKSLDD
jgi:hypothetical protein